MRSRRFSSSRPLKGTGFFARLAAALMAITLVFPLTVNATFSPPLCEDLFTPSRTANDSAWPDLGTLSAASLEYVMRLKYLILERRLIEVPALEKIAVSERPLNPLTGRSMNVTLLPHDNAFKTLLKEELEWASIRQAAKALLADASKEQKRVETATKETEQVLVPTVIASYNFPVRDVVRTSQGQFLAVNTEPGAKGGAFFISAYDLPSGNQVSKTTYTADGNGLPLRLQSFGTTAIASMPGASSNRLISFDLIAGRKLSDPQVAESSVSMVHFADVASVNAQPAVMIGEQNTFRLVNPITGDFGAKVPFATNPTFTTGTSGNVGELIYATDFWGSSYLIDPSGQTPLQSNDGIRAITAFKFQGKTYGFGIVLKGSYPKSNEKILKSFDFASGWESAPIQIRSNKAVWPAMIEQFEQDGTVYGVIATDDDMYVVDLIKGEITRKLSDTPLGLRLLPNPFSVQMTNTAFSYKGKTLMVAILKGEEGTKERHLVILDATTLLPVGMSMKLESNVFRFKMIPTMGDEIFAIVTLTDNTSRLFAFAPRLQKRGAL